jgi:hypothetical protein
VYLIASLRLVPGIFLFFNTELSLLIHKYEIYTLLNRRKKFSFKIHTYMLELYNDKLIDLLAPANKEVSIYHPRPDIKHASSPQWLV